MTGNPLVSVLMTAFNRELYIAESIESVLASTYANFELIIVDDRSTDNTLAIAEKYASSDPRIRVYLNDYNLKDYPNRNMAATFARGKYLKYLDSDDTIYPEGLAYCIGEMEKYPEAAFGLSMIDKDELPVSVLCPGEVAIRKQFFESNHLTAGPTGMIIKRALFEEVGGFDPRFKMASDFYFNIKVALLSPVVLFKRRFFYYRLHANQEQNNPLGYMIYGYLANKEIFETFKLPVSQEEHLALLRKLDRRHSVNLVKNLLLKGKIKDFMNVSRETKYGFLKILHGILAR